MQFSPCFQPEAQWQLHWWGSSNRFAFESESEMSFSDSCSSALAIYDMVSTWKRASAHTIRLGHIAKPRPRAFPRAPACSSPPVHYLNVLCHKFTTSSHTFLRPWPDTVWHFERSRDLSQEVVCLCQAYSGGEDSPPWPEAGCPTQAASPSGCWWPQPWRPLSTRAFWLPVHGFTKWPDFLRLVWGGIITPSSSTSVSEKWRKWNKYHHLSGIKSLRKRKISPQMCILPLSKHTVRSTFCSGISTRKQLTLGD